jgi:hypothetical protein
MSSYFWDHKRQRRSRLTVPEFDELKHICIERFEQGLVRVSNSPHVAPMVRHHVNLFNLLHVNGFAPIIRHHVNLLNLLHVNG